MHIFQCIPQPNAKATAGRNNLRNSLGKKCLNSAPYPVGGRESDSAVQLSGHWRAGSALLPCCWCG